VNPVAAYLLKDTFKRWLEQPWSALARGAVAFFVSAAAFVVLGLFDAAERVIEAKMRRAGVNTVTVARQLTTGALPAGERYAWLGREGGLLVLARPYLDGKSRAGLHVEAYGYAPESMATLAAAATAMAMARTTATAMAAATTTAPAMAAAGGAPAMLVTSALPPALEERVVLADGLELAALTVAPEGVLRLLPVPTNGALLLAPLASLEPAVRARGGVELVIFERREDAAVTLAGCVEALRRLQLLDGTRAEVKSSLDLRGELEAVREARRICAAALCAVFGGLLVLVFSAMAALEYRESRFLAALLRSMGARPRLLVARQAAEAAVVANIGGGAAFAALRLAAHHSRALAGWGLPAGGLELEATSVAAVFCGLSAGALAAALPVAISLRKPVGAVLG
jgi:hypothetical protein